METTIQKQSLYNIRIEHLSLLQMIEDNEGVIDEQIENQLSLTQDQFQEKAISYGFILKTFDDSTLIIESEIKRLQELKCKAEKRKELFKQRLSEAMQQFGVEKITTPTLTLSFRKSESIEIVDEESIPESFTDTKEVTSISKARIKEAIKQGIKVPGAEIITKQNLQVK